MPDVSVTWLGHASFRLDSPEGKRIYVDPFLNGNPKCPESELEPERVDVIALTHGHGDHVGDTVALGKRFEPEIVERPDVVAVAVGERDAADRGAELRRGGDQVVGRAARRGVDERETVVLADEEGVHEAESGELGDRGRDGCGLHDGLLIWLTVLATT